MLPIGALEGLFPRGRRAPRAAWQLAFCLWQNSTRRHRPWYVLSYKSRHASKLFVDRLHRMHAILPWTMLIHTCPCMLNLMTANSKMCTPSASAKCEVLGTRNMFICKWACILPADNMHNEGCAWAKTLSLLCYSCLSYGFDGLWFTSKLTEGSLLHLLPIAEAEQCVALVYHYMPGAYTNASFQ